jgi:hypothetical protein
LDPLEQRLFKKILQAILRNTQCYLVSINNGFCETTWISEFLSGEISAKKKKIRKKSDLGGLEVRNKNSQNRQIHIFGFHCTPKHYSIF